MELNPSFLILNIIRMPLIPVVNDPYETQHIIRTFKDHPD